MDLREALAYLSSKTNLDFVFLSDSIISVREKEIRFCGYLKDSDTKEPLAFVTVQNARRGTISNEEGYFEMDGLKPNETIRIAHIGYKALRQELKNFDALNCSAIYLTPYQEELEGITVYDFLVRGIDKLDNGSFQLDFDRFSILPGLVEDDVLQSLQALPGIQSVDETVSNINIRGGSNDQNLITWDGIKMYQSGHFFGLISMYNPYITNKVELRKNGSSSKDTDGVSGTIAMKTDKRLNTGLTGGIGLNLIDANGFVDTALGKKVSVQVAARKSISNYLETPTYTQFFERMAQDTEIEQNITEGDDTDILFNFYDLGVRLLYLPSQKDRLRVNFITTANEVNFNEVEEIMGIEEVRDSNLEQTSIAGGINYERNWTKAFSSELDVYNSDYSLQATNANIQKDQRFFQKNAVSETSIKLSGAYRLNPKLTLVNGYHFVETKVTNLDEIDDPFFTRLTGEVLRTHAVFSEIRYRSKNSHTQFNLGGRYNYLAKFKRQLLEPRVSFNQDLGKFFNLEILGELKHQNTSQVINFQNDFLGVEKRRWQLSNNGSIPVIRSGQASVGLNFNRKGWLANAELYYKNIDGITTQSQGFQDRFEFVRTSGSYEAKGLDLLLRKQLTGSNIWLGYSYLSSDYLFPSLSEDRFPNNFDITHALTIGANYTFGKLLLASGLNWRTGRPITIPIESGEMEDGEINFGPPNLNRIDDYLRVDLSARYEFAWGKNTMAQVGFSIWNLLGRDNTINAFYRLGMDQTPERVEQSSLGITPNASVKLVFH